MKILLFTSFLFFCISTYGQIFHNDPYKIDNYLYYDIDYTRQEVIKNKIKRVAVYNFEIKKDKIIKKRKEPRYYLEFDINGNPTRYHSQFTYSVWWWYKFLHAIKLHTTHIENHDYSFEYDSMHNLVHIKELLTNTISASKDENDVYFKYDQENRLINEIISNKTIYEEGYKFNGTSYDNDTMLLKYHFIYNDTNLITTIIKWNIYHDFRDTVNQIDTITNNSIFDSLFAIKALPKGVKTDSLGRIIESTFYMIHAYLMGGGCVSPDSENDRINKYYYNSDGKLFKRETYLRKGDFVSTEWITYDSHGLILTSKEDNLKYITCYEYEWY